MDTKKWTLILSIVLLIFQFLFWFGFYGFLGEESMAVGIGLVGQIIFWFALLIILRKDILSKGKSEKWIFAPFFLGAIGGLFYYFIGSSE